MARKLVLILPTLLLGTLTLVSQSAPGPAIHSVAHIDVMPDQLATTQPVLIAYIKQAQHDPAITHIELLQQIDHPNHFTLLETLRDRKAYDIQVSEPYTRTFRTLLQPALGSPYDERLHTSIMPQP